MFIDHCFFHISFPVQRQPNMSTNSNSLLDSSNILNGYKISSGPESSIIKRIKSGGGNLLGSEEMGKNQLRKTTEILRTRYIVYFKFIN